MSIIGKNTLARPEVEAVLEARWAPPASRRAVAEAVKRLGVTLPPAFRGWLSMHGGLTIGFRDAAKARRMCAKLFGADALRREKRTIYDTLGTVPADLIIFGQVRDEDANPLAAMNLLMERRGGEYTYGLLQRHKKQRFFSPRLESFAAWLEHLRELLEKCLVARATAGGSPQKSRT